MNRRVRFVAGLVTTVVMVFSLAETIWAATCSPANGPANAVVAGAEGVPQCDGCLPASHDEHGDDRPGCPFGPVAASQTCVTATSLPARPTVHLGTPADIDAPIPAFDIGRELLLAATFFRPPKS